MQLHAQDNHKFMYTSLANSECEGGKIVRLEPEDDGNTCYAWIEDVTPKVTYIDKVEFTGMAVPSVGTLVSGATPGATVSEDAGYEIVGQSWLDGTGYAIGEGVAFEAGEAYLASLTLQPKPGYRFAKNGSVTTTISSDDAEIYQTEYKNAEASVLVAFEPAYTPINKVSLTATQPLAGQKVSDVAAPVSIAGNASYQISNMNWWSTDDHALDLNTTFEAGKTYRIAVTLVPDKGYAFDPAGVHAAVTGNTATRAGEMQLGYDTVHVFIDVTAAKPATFTLGVNGGTTGDAWEDNKVLGTYAVGSAVTITAPAMLDAKIATAPEGKTYGGYLFGSRVLAPGDTISYPATNDLTVNIRWIAEDPSTVEDLCAKGHTKGTAEKVNEYAATCTEVGSYEEVVHCTVCGAELSREKVKFAALGHDWNEGFVTTEPTCTEAGVKTYVCKREGCNESKTEDIPALGHEWGAWVEEGGKATRTCAHDASHVETVDITYSAESGDGATWTKGTTDALTFTFKRSVNDDKTYEAFKGAKVDGVDVDASNLTTAKGSLILSLASTYLETLTVGDHTLTVAFGDGEVTAAFTVKAAETKAASATKSASAKTGDTTPVALLLVSALLSGAVLLVTRTRRQS